MLRDEGQVSGAFIRVDPSHEQALYRALKRTPAVAGVTIRATALQTISDGMNRSFILMTVVMTAFAVVLVVGVVYNSARIALSERGDELASLRVLGFHKSEVTTLLLGEQALLTAAAIPLGLCVGNAICRLLVPGVRPGVVQAVIRAEPAYLWARDGRDGRGGARLGCPGREADRQAGPDRGVEVEGVRSMQRRVKTMIYAAAAAAGAILIAIATRPAPIPVEIGTVRFAPMQVAVEEQGETRSHDRFVVAAPVAGRLLRLGLREGDPVAANQIVAAIAPLPLGTRERSELAARVAAAEAALRASRAQREHVLEDLEQARRERTRLESLYAQEVASRQELEQGRNAETTLEKDAAAARFRVRTAAAELRAAQAGLVALPERRAGAPATVEVRAPAAGRVLRVQEPSERVVAAGTPIMVIGDLDHLEVVMEMLSSEAVNVAPGMRAALEGWGGEGALRARVRSVEPYAFTKVSALGVEEKRTNVILDFVDPPGRLGDGFRVTGRIVLWSSPRTLVAPLSSSFRCGADWCVFVADGARARQRRVVIGHRNPSEVEISSGLRAGDRVILHPPNDLADGARIRAK